MPTFDITLNIYLFLLILAVAAALGYSRRGRQLAKKQRKIVELEHEMVQAHAELLENQREYCELELRMKKLDNGAIATGPVIPMKEKNRPTGTDQ